MSAPAAALANAVLRAYPATLLSKQVPKPKHTKLNYTTLHPNDVPTLLDKQNPRLSYTELI